MLHTKAYSSNVSLFSSAYTKLTGSQLRSGREFRAYIDEIHRSLTFELEAGNREEPTSDINEDLHQDDILESQVKCTPECICHSM